MAHTVPWDSSFNNQPVGTQKVGDTHVFVRQSRQGVAERIGQEHNMELSDSATDNQGKHNEGSARIFVQETAPTDPSVTKETVYVEGETPDFKSGRMYFNPTARTLWVYDSVTSSFIEATPLGTGDWDLVIDNDTKLATWAASGTYARVLIKAGTWTLASGGVDLTARGTKLVVGEPGSKLVFSSAEKGLYYTTPLTTNDYRMEGVIVETTSSSNGYGFHSCANLTNCTGTGTGTDIIGSGFYNCTSLTNCTGTGTGGNNGYGFYNCTSLTNCTGTGTGGNGGAGFVSCKNLTNCTGTGTGTGNNGYGFYNCKNLINCTGTGTGAAGYGFYSCTKCQQNKKGGNSTTATYTDSYADAGTSYPCADTPNGGFNS
jgi:hypothetical protein